jgi:hypothetical protein
LLPPRIDVLPDIDFGFLGIPTPHRLAVVERLRRYVKVVWPNGILPPAEAKAFFQQFKIGLSFRQSQDWPIPSPTRLGRLLHACRGIVAEPTPVITRQSSLVPTLPEGMDLVDFALERLASPWQAEAENALELYRSIMPMRNIMQNVLDITLNGIRRATSSCVNRDRISWQMARPLPVLTEARPLPVLTEAGYEGFNLIQLGERYIGMSQAVGSIDVRLANNDEIIKSHQEEGRCFIGDSIFEVKNHILQKKIAEQAKQIMKRDRELYQIKSQWWHRCIKHAGKLKQKIRDKIPI